MTAEPKKVYYDCEICGHFHPWNWDGDCRDDANRFTYDQLDNLHGSSNYEIATMKERVVADESGKSWRHL